MMTYTLLIFLPAFFASVFSIVIRGKSINKMYGVSVFVSFSTTVIAIYNAYLVFYGNSFVINFGSIFGNPAISLQTTSRAMIFCTMISILYPIATLYTIAYARANHMPHKRAFFCFFHLSIMFGLMLGLSASLITMFIFYELITVSTYPLVVHNRDVEAKRAGRVYLVHLITSSSFLFLPAIIIIQATVGSVGFREGGMMSGYQLSAASINILFAMVVFGIAKTAIFPLHSWLPSAMVAPTPVSAILHAVVVVKSGLFVLITTIYYVFGASLLKANLFSIYGENWLTILSGGNIIIMSMMAIFQDKIKKRLAYSTIAQLSYSILAASIFTKEAMNVALLLMVAHAFAKITLFFGAGIIYTKFHKDSLSQMYGIGHAMPATMFAICIACVSIIGLPVSIGFGAKYHLLYLAISYKQVGVIVLIVISTLLSVSYCFPLIYNTLFAKNYSPVDLSHKLSHKDSFLFGTVMVINSILIVFGFFLVFAFN